MKICKKIKKIIMLAFAFLFCLTGTSCASEEERSDIDPNGNTLVESRLNETRAKEIYLKELIFFLMIQDMVLPQVVNQLLAMLMAKMVNCFIRAYLLKIL